MIQILKHVTATSSNGSLTFNMTGVPEGAFLLAIVRNQVTTATSDFTGPAGWNRYGPAFMPSNAGARVFSAWGRFASGDVSAAFSIPGTTTGRTVGMLVAFTGVDPQDPVIAQSDNYLGNSIGGEPYNIGGGTYTFDTTPARDALQLTYGANELVAPNDVAAITVAPGSTKDVVAQTNGDSSVTRSVVVLASNPIPLGSASVPSNSMYVGWPAVSGATGHSLVLQSAPEAPRPLEVKLADGRNASLFAWDGSKSNPVLAMRKVHPGFESVTEMLATPGFTWAHRGGSANWGEMSLHAYTQAMLAGYGVMEISLARTSDGVWFGHHDETMSRVTNGASTADPFTLTWAQVQELQITNGADGIARPFMRIEEFIDAYGGAGVVVLDIKYGIRSTEYINEFIALCKRFPTDQVIVKYFYDAASFSQRAISEGFATWGYAYPENLTDDPNFATRAQEWTILGMTHSADQTVWDQMLAFGKPVVGHIANTQAQYDAAMAKGAAGVQCANVLGINPVSNW